MFLGMCGCSRRQSDAVLTLVRSDCPRAPLLLEVLRAAQDLALRMYPTLQLRVNLISHLLLIKLMLHGSLE